MWIRLGLLAGTTIGAAATYKYWDVGTGIVRLTRTGVTVGSIVYDYKKTIYSGRAFSDTDDEYQEIKHSVHQRSADKLLDLCRANGGVFIKVGQHLGTLDYLLPQEYVRTLKVLHNNAPTCPLREILNVFKEDLKIDPSDVLTDFDPTPIGAASLAQVHKARLKKDGTQVAVKIQYPMVRNHAYVDIKSLEILMKVVVWIFPDFSFQWLVDETKKNVPKELDFLQEGKNSEKVTKLYQHFLWFKVPKVFWDLSTSRVLTMEYFEGGKVDDIDYMHKHGIDPVEVNQKLGELYSEMIFVNGYVHCDPHPGNILIYKAPEGIHLCLLDHGLYTSLSDEFRWNYAKLWLNIIHANVEGIQKFGNKLGVGKYYSLFACMITARSWKSIVSGIDKTGETSKEMDEVRENAGKFLPMISQVLSNVSREMVLIFKTNDLLRGVAHSLQTSARKTSFLTMSKCCIRAVYGEKEKYQTSSYGRAFVILTRKWEIMKINLYETFLWFQSIWNSYYIRLFSVL